MYIYYNYMYYNYSHYVTVMPYAKTLNHFVTVVAYAKILNHFVTVVPFTITTALNVPVDHVKPNTSLSSAVAKN